jgi:hypothetical protein
MFFVYIDDSTERPTHVFSALLVHSSRWNRVFAAVKAWRTELRDTDHIPLNYELHARKFLSGRGTLGTLGEISRHRRARIFDYAFSFGASLQPFGVRSINVCLSNDRQDWAFERLINRINRTMAEWHSYAHLVCDEGKEDYYVKMVRRMRVHNLIPSKQGVWMDTGERVKNIPLERIVEDPQFKSSARSYFIQLVDFYAFGVLRREKPTPSVKRHGAHKSFEKLKPIIVPECNTHDPFGIIR